MQSAELARIGDVIECKVRHPQPGVVRMELATPEACAYANSLLMAPESGWTLPKVGSSMRLGTSVPAS